MSIEVEVRLPFFSKKARMQLLDLSTARQKVFADIQRYLQEVRSITAADVETAEAGIRTLSTLRRAAYEDLNQIQHEYAVLCAVEWVIAQNHVDDATMWFWNPRQTGDASEPDLRGVSRGKTFLSGEVTTSAKPNGVIASRMASTLGKLNSMEGSHYYFVLTDSMAKRARTKVRKGGYDVEVVCLPGAAVAVSLPQEESQTAD